MIARSTVAPRIHLAGYVDDETLVGLAAGPNVCSTRPATRASGSAARGNGVRRAGDRRARHRDGGGRRARRRARRRGRRRRLRTALEHLLGSLAARLEYSGRGLARASRFSWQRCAETTTAVYAGRRTEAADLGQAASTPPLSVVLGTTQRWPELEPLIESVMPQARELGAEVIVVDNNGVALPEQLAAETPEIVWITDPGASIFRMRSLGIPGRPRCVIALTEDHCVLRQVVPGTHRRPRRPSEVPAVGGAVANGATRELSAWGQFRSTTRSGCRLSRAGCGRWSTARTSPALGRTWSTPTRPEVAEPLIDDRLLQSGATFFLSADAAVTHDQSFGLRGTLDPSPTAAGRSPGRASVAGLVSAGGSRRRSRARAGACDIRPDRPADRAAPEVHPRPREPADGGRGCNRHIGGPGRRIPGGPGDSARQIR